MARPPFQTLLDRHRDELYRFLVYAAGPAEAPDCFQEAVLAALRAYPRLSDTRNLRGWLYAIAHRKAIDAHRARGRRAVPTADVPDSPAAPVELTDPNLWAAVRELPPMQRAAVVLRYVADLPYVRIGEIAGCSEGAARQNVRAGLARLREEWRP